MSTFLVTVPAFLFALGVIVFVHEFGHFAVAKMFGVRVLTFSLGFGKRLWGFDYKGTDCRISAIPFGGYVQMSGEMPDGRPPAPGEFSATPRWQRILVYLAGPAMNMVLSVALIAYVFMDGIPEQALEDMSSVIGTVVAESPAAAAGLEPDDRVMAIDGVAIDKWKDLAFTVLTSPEKAITMTVERAGERFDTVVTPDKVPRYEYGEAGLGPKLQLRISDVFGNSPAYAAGLRSGDAVISIDGQPITHPEAFVDQVKPSAGTTLTVRVRRVEEILDIPVTPIAVEGEGRMGVIVSYYRKLPLTEAIPASIRYNVEIVQKSIQILGKLFTNQIAAKSALSGPIEIATWSGKAAQRGWKELLYTMGFLSISIGFMNLLPIPVLDGGHISILLVESALRRDLSVVIKERVMQVGFMALMMLMIVVIFFDLSKNLPSLMPGS